MARVVQSRNGTAVRTVDYAYYGSGSSNAGDLQTVTKRNGDASSAVVTNYYRWYTRDTSSGYVGGLKFYLGDEAYQKVIYDNGSAIDAVTAEGAEKCHEAKRMINPK